MRVSKQLSWNKRIENLQESLNYIAKEYLLLLLRQQDYKLVATLRKTNIFLSLYC